MRISDWSSDVCSSDLVRVNSTRQPFWTSCRPMAAAKWLFPPPGGPNRMRLAPFSSHPSPEVMAVTRSEEHTSELQSLMRISYAVFCLKKKKIQKHNANNYHDTRPSTDNNKNLKKRQRNTYDEQTVNRRI